MSLLIMEGSLCTQILPPAPATPAQALALAPAPRGTRAVQGSRVLGEQNKFRASRESLCSQVRREEGEGRRLQHHHSPARSCSRVKHTVSQASTWYLAPPHPAAAARSWAVPWSSPTNTPSTALLPPARAKNNPQRFKRLLKFIRCHCASFKKSYRVCFERAWLHGERVKKAGVESSGLLHFSIRRQRLFLGAAGYSTGEGAAAHPLTPTAPSWTH